MQKRLEQPDRETDRNRGIIVVSGIPGAGKSTLSSLAIVKACHLGRTARTVSDQWPHLDHLARSTSHGLQVDTSALSPEQTVSAVLADVCGSGCITGPL